MTASVIALVGNPNCGKTTLFNALTGARQRVGNWPGVTVEKKTGQFEHAGRSIEVHLQAHQLLHDVLPLLLEERRRESRRLQSVDRIDQLLLPMVCL